MTNKLTPVKPDLDEPETVQDAMLLELRKHTEYMHRMDWKLWMIMNMIKLIGEENGYMFKTNDEDKTKTTGEFE